VWFEVEDVRGEPDEDGIVRRTDDCDPSLGRGAREQSSGDPPVPLVQPCGRLVDEQQVDVGRECARDRHPLPLTGRESACALVELSAESDFLQGAGRPLRPVRHLPDPECEEDVLARRQVRNEARLLRDQSDPLSAERGELRTAPAGQRHAGDVDLAAIGALQAGEQMEQRGLAGPGAADDGGQPSRAEAVAQIGEHHAVQEFVNTVDHQHGREWLATPAALRDWLVERGLMTPGSRVRRADLDRAWTFRAALRELVVAGDRAVDRRSIATLEDAARAAGLTFLVDGDGATLVAGAPGVTGALGRLLIVFFEASLDGSWRRLKACPNCNWAFYDYSRNRSATWCSMRLCGNRTKTRSYYRRRADRQRRKPA
jgi:hypothetical protein